MSKEILDAIAIEVSDAFLDNGVLIEHIATVSIAEMIDANIDVMIVECNNASKAVGEHMLGLIVLKPPYYVSIKLKNIIKKNRKLLITMVELALTTSFPMTPFQAVMFILLVLYKISELSIVSLSEPDAHVLLFLHLNGAYEKGFPESVLYKHFQSNGTINKDTVSKSIEHLKEVKCIEIEAGTINLVERIFLT